MEPFQNMTCINSVNKVQNYVNTKIPIMQFCWLVEGLELELVSKELYHLAAILQHHAGSLIFMK